MPRSKFMPDTIVALLKAACEGESFYDVIRLSGTDINYNTLVGWIVRGRRELKGGADTAHAKFAAEWDKRFSPFNSTNGEVRNMAAMDRALEMLEEA